MSGRNNNKLPSNLPQLQNLIKRDPPAYTEEVGSCSPGSPPEASGDSQEGQRWGRNVPRTRFARLANALPRRARHPRKHRCKACCLRFKPPRWSVPVRSEVESPGRSAVESPGPRGCAQPPATVYQKRELVPNGMTSRVLKALSTDGGSRVPPALPGPQPGVWKA